MTPTPCGRYLVRVFGLRVALIHDAKRLDVQKSSRSIVIVLGLS